MMPQTEFSAHLATPMAMDMATTASSEPTICVMVVEDQQAIAELLLDVLGDAGFKAIYAPSAVTAAGLARDIRPSVILLDVMMPDRNGWEVLDELRADPVTREIPVVITSAVYDRPGLHAMPAGGPIRFAAKPFDIADLVDTVEDLTS